MFSVTTVENPPSGGFLLLGARAVFNSTDLSGQTIVGTKTMLKDVTRKIRSSSVGKTMVVGVLTALAFAVLSLLQPTLLSNLIRGSESGITGQKYNLLLLLAVVLLSSVVQGVSVLSEGVAVSRIKHLYQSEILKASALKGTLKRKGAFVQAMVEDVDIVSKYYVGLATKALPALVMVVVAGVAVVIIDALLTLVVVVICLLIFTALLFVSKRIGRIEMQVIQARNGLAEVLTLFSRAITTIKPNRRYWDVLGHVERNLDNLEQKSIDATRWKAKVSPVNGSLLPIVAIVVLGVASLRLNSGAISLDDLIAYVMYLFILMTPLVQAISLVGRRGEALAAYDQLRDHLDVNDAEDSVPVEIRERVEKTLSEDFPSSGLVVITGPSGIGKTTLLRELGRKSQSAALTLVYVEQFPPQWMPNARASQVFYADKTKLEDFEQLAQSFRISPYILDRPMEGLSGGEQQRIAIAAALTAETDVVLLDEPTSSISEEDEKLLAHEINKLARVKRLIVVVTHDIHFIEMLEMHSVIRMA